MSAKRKARLPVRPKSNGDNGKFLDYVSRAGTKGVAVGSEDCHNPEMVVIQAQLGGRREPRDFFNPPNVIDLFDLNPDIKKIPQGKKWCSACGEWVDKSKYSEDRRNRDGLQPHCKVCRAEHARRMYWLKKDSAVAMPIAA